MCQDGKDGVQCNEPETDGDSDSFGEGEMIWRVWNRLFFAGRSTAILHNIYGCLWKLTA